MSVKFSKMIKNIWTVFYIAFFTSVIVFSIIFNNMWKSTNEIVFNKQKTHIELFSNSVKSFFKSQESMLEVLGSHLISRHSSITFPIHDIDLDKTIESNPVLISLALVSFDGKPIVASSNFDLDNLPDVFGIENKKPSFLEARESRELQVGATYAIHEFETQTFAMPIRKSIFIDDKAQAFMTAQINMEDTPIFSAHQSLLKYHQIEIIRRDQIIQFSSNSQNYWKPVEDAYFDKLNEINNNDIYYDIFDYKFTGQEENFQVVSYYEPYFGLWFVSKMERNYIYELFWQRFSASFFVFILYNALMFLLVFFINRSETRKKEELYKLAHFDALTGLPNRRYVLKRLNNKANNNKKSKLNTALLFLDIDNFKAVNDTYGHQYGDSLLIQVASRIESCLSVRDVLARFAGDEFLVIIDDLGYKGRDQAQFIAQKLVDCLSSSYYLLDIEYLSTVSIGVVMLESESYSSSELLKYADYAMYRAKEQGKNGICFFETDLRDELMEKMLLEDDLRAALNSSEFELYYQPQIGRNKQVVGAEALIRWNHPYKGIVGPNDFMSSAEKTGLILPIGEWVLREACRQLVEWSNDEITQDLTLSVNVSYVQFSHPGFMSMVLKAIEEYQFPVELLKLELTETMLIDNIAQTAMRMEELQGRGVQFSLDDFGTGYSSLVHLKSLPLSELKIDRSFVKDLECDKSDKSIVKAMIRMAEELNISLIAEGVENENQAKYLIEQGCRIHQGYLYSRPLPIAMFKSYLTSTSTKRLKLLLV
ncbi:EAL domain-containing protein [Vibrio sp. 99-70-13A1]|uniref:putative bifunctional diguanylate cyclase/phosphodiesterase n=1 Tax=Vibrio sp. 99-70-13A1 TaxID=2607601 RepID=UPI001493B8D8|nr:EAL domain-containing protein [Vibrio sp. 99-70-13A1]NOH98980.1 EAL domain-containing protein [Vibrio sp. 99-70-13A1]